MTGELCGHSFSAAVISTINKILDETLTKFVRRRMTDDYPYVILDACHEKARDESVIPGQAALIAIGINREGKREVPGVEFAKRDSQTSWRKFF